jgi:hypothetical protein
LAAVLLLAIGHPDPRCILHEELSLESGRKVLGYVEADVVDERCVGIICHSDFRGPP